MATSHKSKSNKSKANGHESLKEKSHKGSVAQKSVPEIVGKLGDQSAILAPEESLH